MTYAASGFESEYWGGPYKEILPWIENHADDKFWVPINTSSLKHYYDLGILKSRVRFAGRDESDYLILLCRQGAFTAELWEFYLHGTPVRSVELFGTPLLAVYKLTADGPRPLLSAVHREVPH